MSSLSSENIKSASPISIGSLLVKDSSGNFRPAVQADITALGFSVGGGGGPVDGLDGIVFSDTSMEFRANYRGATIGTWGEVGAGCWYDNIDKYIYVSNDNNIKKYNINFYLL